MRAGPVDLVHQLPVCFPGGGELLFPFFGAAAQVEVFLPEGLDLFVQRGDVGRGAESGALADLAAAQREIIDAEHPRHGHLRQRQPQQ